VNVAKSTSPQFFEHPVPGVSGELDSSAEDCSTGIIFAPAEDSVPSQAEIADISNSGTAPEAVFTPGSPGPWTAPEQVQTQTGSDLSAGASGSAVAQGTDTGVVSGEFGRRFADRARAAHEVRGRRRAGVQQLAHLRDGPGSVGEPVLDGR
jgi:hypothetical protein